MRPKPVRRWRLFLDANILISAAWKEESKVARIWAIPSVELVTSNHVLTECRRNLPREEQHHRLARLLLKVRVLEFSAIPVLENPPLLHAKDQPVLAAAVLSRADFLVTGDRAHFGEWFGSSVAGIRVEPPARFPSVLEEEQYSFR
jgi:predicted nucleic acid-binding protein